MTLLGIESGCMGLNGLAPSSCDSRCNRIVALMVSIMSFEYVCVDGGNIRSVEELEVDNADGEFGDDHKLEVDDDDGL